jgi:hypothetical protein
MQLGPRTGLALTYWESATNYQIRRISGDRETTLYTRQTCTWPKFSENFGAEFPENKLSGETRKKNQKISIDLICQQ